MTAAAGLKHAMERSAKAIKLRPSVARGTSVSRATILDGCVCEIVEGPWKLIVDLPKSEGGANKGPTPGVLGRGALGSCLAMGIVAQAAVHNVPLDGVSVEVQADWDGRGYLGLNQDTPPGYTRLRVTVDVKSMASAERVSEIVRLAERLSPYIDVFRRTNEVIVETRIAPPEKG
jgi:uncharacterized OsmC-like protein